MKGRSDDDEDVSAPPDTNVDVSKNRDAVKITSIFLAFSPEKIRDYGTRRELIFSDKTAHFER